MPLYDYKCTNEKCDTSEKELLVKVSDRDEQKCDKCNSELKRQPNKTAGPNVTWSLWQVG